MSTEVLTWILDRGLSGGLLVAVVILGMVVRAMRRDEKDLHRQLAAARELHTADVRAVQVASAAEVAKLHEARITALGAHHAESLNAHQRAAETLADVTTALNRIFDAIGEDEKTTSDPGRKRVR